MAYSTERCHAHSDGCRMASAHRQFERQPGLGHENRKLDGEDVIREDHPAARQPNQPQASNNQCADKNRFQGYVEIK
jgi:hypothetical protein